jgi:hypothetical protein
MISAAWIIYVLTKAKKGYFYEVFTRSGKYILQDRGIGMTYHHAVQRLVDAV